MSSVFCISSCLYNVDFVYLLRVPMPLKPFYRNEKSAYNVASETLEKDAF